MEKKLKKENLENVSGGKIIKFIFDIPDPSNKDNPAIGRITSYNLLGDDNKLLGKFETKEEAEAFAERLGFSTHVYKKETHLSKLSVLDSHDENVSGGLISQNDTVLNMHGHKTPFGTTFVVEDDEGNEIPTTFPTYYSAAKAANDYGISPELKVVHFTKNDLPKDFFKPNTPFSQRNLLDFLRHNPQLAYKFENALK